MVQFNVRRLSDTELRAFFAALFPRGFHGSDVLSEIALACWPHSPAIVPFRRRPDGTGLTSDSDQDIEKVIDLVGRCVWDVFSDNHEVILADRRFAYLGTWRSASSFLAEYAPQQDDDPLFGNELQFYGGTGILRADLDLMPIYRTIFRRLRTLGADWIYHLPRIYYIEPIDARSCSVGIAAAARDDEWCHQPPTVVRAYVRVFGRAPQGWPRQHLSRLLS